MAKYDAAGDRIKRSTAPFFIVLMIIGVIILIAGIVLWYNTDMSKYSKTCDIDETYSGNAVNVEIQYHYGNFTLNRSSDDKIHVMGKNIPEGIKIDAEGDKFCLKYEERNIFGLNGVLFDKSSDDIELVVSLPEKDYNKVEIDSGAGNVKICDLNYNDFDIDAGAGNIDIQRIYCVGGGTTELDLGAGNTEIKDSMVKDIDADLGAGDFSFEGDAAGKIDIDCGVGDCEITLEKPEEMYSFHGDMKNKYGSSNGEYDVYVDTGVGNVTFKFGK